MIVELLVIWVVAVVAFFVLWVVLAKVVQKISQKTARFASTGMKAEESADLAR